MLAFVYAANAQCWAIGQQQGNGFKVRRVVWGKTLANAEKRAGEEITKALILVPPKSAKRGKTWTERNA